MENYNICNLIQGGGGQMMNNNPWQEITANQCDQWQDEPAESELWTFNSGIQLLILDFLTLFYLQLTDVDS